MRVGQKDIVIPMLCPVPGRGRPGERHASNKTYARTRADRMFDMVNRDRTKATLDIVSHFTRCAAQETFSVTFYYACGATSTSFGTFAEAPM